MPLTKDEMLAKVEATKGITTDDKLNNIRVLWKKGRNMFASFLTEVGEVKKQIDDDKVFAEWCFWQLHIGVHAITDLTCVLQQDDADRIKVEFAAAKKAAKEQKDAEAHAEKLKKIKMQNELDEEKAKNAVFQAKQSKFAAAEAKKEKEKIVTERRKARTEAEGIDGVERARRMMIENPKATRDQVCAPEGADVNHADEKAARAQLVKEGLLPPRGASLSDDDLYRSCVERGRKAANMQWTLGDLAIEVTALKSYGEGKLAKFADDIGVEYSTLRGYMAVAKAWPEIVERSTNWSVAMVLSTHPDRVALVEANPAMTVAEAREIMREYKAPNVVNLRGI